MVSRRKRSVLALHLAGFGMVFLYVCLVSVLTTWGLQCLALLFGETYDWEAVLVHLILSLSFLAFFPGQTLWTVRLRDSNGKDYVIIGKESSRAE